MTERILIGTYDYRLVVVSVLIGVLTSYAWLDVRSRVTASSGRAWLAWLLGGSISIGIGIWSMHYVAMLAFRLPVPIRYDWPTTLLSLSAAVLASLVALLVVSRRDMRVIPAIAASLLMGSAIVALHYIAMAAMRLPAECHYSPPLVTFSVLLAFGGSWLALELTFVFREEHLRCRIRKIGSSLAMGGAIAGMHYTAMAAATFTPSPVPPDLSHAVRITTLELAVVIGVPIMVLVATIVTSMMGRLQKQKALLDELFEQIPAALALADKSEAILRINREFTRMFGYSLREVSGRRLKDVIVCQASRDQDYWENVKRGERVETDDTCRRRDGSYLNVAVSLVPFALPEGESAIYAIYRDITERQQAHAALTKLSEQLLESQEEERRRLARELHDSTGQKLAALAMNLGVLDESALVLDTRAKRALNQSFALASESLREIRTLAHLLHPPELEDLGLTDAVSQYVGGFVERSGIPVHLKVGYHLGRLPPEVETAIFRIVQESLTNIHRHSGGAQASVEIGRDASGITLNIADQGKRLRTDNANGERKLPVMPGVGIAGMRERVTQLGGRLDIWSTEQGTMLEAFIPVKEP